jgi:hypothetical protein
VANLNGIGTLRSARRIGDLVKTVGAPTEHTLVGEKRAAMRHPKPQFEDFARHG